MDVIDLVTDSGPRPTEAMREAARDATTGKSGIGDGPTMADVEDRVADLVGMDGGVFVPSGTMGNQVAARAHAGRGSEVVVEAGSHLYTREAGGLAAMSGLQARPVDGGERGVISPEQVHENCVEGTIQHPETGLVALENTHMSKGGTAIEPEAIDAAAEAAGEHGVPVHLDGARLLHAAVALDRPPERFGRYFDSVYVDLSKLGAPAGGVLTGGEGFVERARRIRQAFGGHLEGTGLLAAPTMVALDETDRLAVDQEHAALLAAGLDEDDALSVEEPETNLVFVDVSATGMTDGAFIDACEERGVLGKPFGGGRVRFCPDRDSDREDVEAAVDRIRAVAG